jgi:hypothetical protein
MTDGPDIWLTPAQATYFLFTGENIAGVARLSEARVIGKLTIAAAFVPMSADPGPEECAAALIEIKKQLATAGESPCVVANKWRDDLVAAGLVTTEGKRTPSGPYETIKPVELCDLKFSGPHAVNARGGIVFYNVRLSGLGLLRARQQTIASGDMAPSAVEHVQVTSDRQPAHPSGLVASRKLTASSPTPIPIDAKPATTSSKIHIQTKRDALASWIAERYPEGIPPGITAKVIARDFELEKKIVVHVRTVRRALGRN